MCVCVCRFVICCVSLFRVDGPSHRLWRGSHSPRLVWRVADAVYIYIYIYTPTCIHTYIHVYIYIERELFLLITVMLMITSVNDNNYRDTSVREKNTPPDEKTLLGKISSRSVKSGAGEPLPAAGLRSQGSRRRIASLFGQGRRGS